MRLSNILSPLYLFMLGYLQLGNADGMLYLNNWSGTNFSNCVLGIFINGQAAAADFASGALPTTTAGTIPQHLNVNVASNSLSFKHIIIQCKEETTEILHTINIPAGDNFYKIGFYSMPPSNEWNSLVQITGGNENCPDKFLLQYTVWDPESENIHFTSPHLQEF